MFWWGRKSSKQTSVEEDSISSHSTSAGMGNSEAEQDENSSYSESRLQLSYTELDYPIQKEDWAAVGVTAALLASQSPEDAAEKKVDFQGDMNADRAAELDRLVEAGDWAEVVAAAAKYEMANQSPMMVPMNKPPSPRPITSSAPPADPNDYYYYKVMNGGAEVYLISQGVGNDGAKQIAHALRDPNCKVLELGLGYNNFGVEGSMAIAEALTT